MQLAGGQAKDASDPRSVLGHNRLRHQNSLMPSFHEVAQSDPRTRFSESCRIDREDVFFREVPGGCCRGAAGWRRHPWPWARDRIPVPPVWRAASRRQASRSSRMWSEGRRFPTQRPPDPASADSEFGSGLPEAQPRLFSADDTPRLLASIFNRYLFEIPSGSSTNTDVRTYLTFTRRRVQLTAWFWPGGRRRRTPLMPAGETADRSKPALALSGGGFRATLYHLGAVMRLNELGVLSQLERVSSVSGGSITAGMLGAAWGRLTFVGGVATNLEAEVGKPLKISASAWSMSPRQVGAPSCLERPSAMRLPILTTTSIRASRCRTCRTNRSSCSTPPTSRPGASPGCRRCGSRTT